MNHPEDRSAMAMGQTLTPIHPVDSATSAGKRPPIGAVYHGVKGRGTAPPR